MLNKIRKQILPMLDTLGDALGQYLDMPTEEMLGEVSSFIDVITETLVEESKDATTLSEKLKLALLKPVHDSVESAYTEFCEMVSSIPVQYKVVFLPYYDNTWDSLKSVYEAFAADPMFVTEIVIIPIRRNTLTGSKHVYNDYLTPQGIPNTHYDKYDFAIDQPDVVFYNQPYDGVNYPKFQSHNIKPHAGLMVYIPYFLYRHRRLDVEKQKNLLLNLPGHNNADVIVAQGDSYCKINKYSKNRNKFVVLGSPKCDSIYWQKDSYPRYPEWDEVTAGKTVFLLNTHYSAVISGSFQTFMGTVLEIFENNEDLALIWRPHPQSFMMQSESDQKEISKEFQDSLNHVVSHPRMIVDRTSSNVSALMYCDAVLTEDSSLIVESIYADKPVFLLSNNPDELLPEGMKYVDSLKHLASARKYDAKNLFFYSVVDYYGYDESMPLEIMTDACFGQLPLLRFIEEIRSGVDRKKHLRGLFREQSFANTDGTCGRSVHDYVANLLNEYN